MYFYLKEPKSTKETSILIQYSGIVEKGNFKFYTGEKVLRENWDFDNRMPKSIQGKGGAKLRNLRAKLTPYNTFLEKMINFCELNEIDVTRSFLQDEFNKRFPKKNKRVKASKDRFEYFTDFIDDFIIKAPNLINRSTKKKYTESRIKSFKKTRTRLKSYEKHKETRIRIDSFDLSTHDSFVNYLDETCAYATNYISTLVKITKKLLKVADKEFKYNVHNDYTEKEFNYSEEESIAIAWSEDEIDLMYKHDFSYDKDLQNCRDLAIIGIWSGLRVSDFMRLQDINPNDKFIIVKPQKTKETTGIRVVIPLHYQVKEIIKRRGMPKTISEDDFNKSIKIICRVIGLKNEVKGSLMVYNEEVEAYRKKVDFYPKYKLVSSHTCRRTFATVQYKIGLPILTIMNITGHTTQRNFLKYIKVTDEEHAEKMLNHWKEYYKLRGKVEAA